ncbi:MAG: hypothetical protein IJQ23_00210 [Clostridia bacterium]|nr:hypothetical protein [Clostridia bacterium]
MKKLSKLIAGVMAISAIFSMTACMGESDIDIDKNKTQIYIAGYDGGVGNAWLDDLANEWNANNDAYQIIQIPTRISQKDLSNSINTGVTDYDVYFTGDVGYVSNIYNGTLEDLSDVGAMKVDGNDRTILQKIGYRDDYYETVWKPVASKNGQGLYMLPYCDNFGGFIFDYNTFVEKGILSFAQASDTNVKSALTAQGISYTESNGRLKVSGYTGSYDLFNYKTGDYILTAGKDGLYGTYDDGQPTTQAEWDQMLARITGANMKPFLWTGGYPEYADMILESLFAYYAGMSEFNTYYNFNGQVTVNGAKVNITPDNGYDVYGIDAMRNALNFMNDYLNNSNYYHSKTTTSDSHTDAQGTFILGYKQNKDQPAMIVEGNWWENEARSVFDTSEVVNAGRGYGQRDYRYMLLPKLSGAYGLDGNGNGSIMSVINSGAVLVPKVGNSEEEQAKLAQIKDFLGFMLKDENLAKFTVKTGVINAYSYELTKAQFDSLTPFSKNVYAMIHDKTNIDFARGALMFAGQPVRFATNGGFFTMPRLITYNKVSHPASMIALRQGVTPEQLMSGAVSYYSHDTFKGATTVKWETLIAQARESGFYK